MAQGYVGPNSQGPLVNIAGTSQDNQGNNQNQGIHNQHQGTHIQN